MKVKINGKETTTDAITIHDLIRQKSPESGNKGIAIAINGSVVPKERWHEHHLNEEDVIEIVRATQGG